MRNRHLRQSKLLQLTRYSPSTVRPCHTAYSTYCNTTSRHFTIMSDRRLYTRLRASELHLEIQTYTSKINTTESNAHAIRPPLGILKKLLANRSMNNNDGVNDGDSIIWGFVVENLVKFGEFHEQFKKLALLLLESVLNGSHFNASKSHNHGHGHGHGNGGNLEWVDTLYEYLKRTFMQNGECDSEALRVLASVEKSSIVGESAFCKFSDLLYTVLEERLGGSNGDAISYYEIYSCLRSVQKIAVCERDVELRNGKISGVFDTLVNVLSVSDDLCVVSAVAGTLLEMTSHHSAFPFLDLHAKLNSGDQLLLKLIGMLNQLRSAPQHAAAGVDIPALLSLLTAFNAGVPVSEQHEVMECVKPFAMSEDTSIVLNSIKCLIHFMNDDSIQETIVYILRSFECCFQRNDGEMMAQVEYRGIFFSILRNLLLIVIRFSKEICRDESGMVDTLIDKYIALDERVDVETYIIDTKLELLYVLSLNDVGRSEKILRMLKPLIKSANSDISYKSLRTLFNLIIKDGKRYRGVLEDLVSSDDIYSFEKRVLSLSIPLREMIDTDATDLGKRYLKHLSMLGEDRIHAQIADRDNVYVSDEDVVAYTGLLGNLSDVTALLALENALVERTTATETPTDTMDESQSYILEVYASSLVRAWATASAADLDTDTDAVVLHSLQRVAGLSGAVERRVNACLRLVTAAGAINAPLTATSIDPVTPAPVGLDVAAAGELCAVLGSLACVYLRPVAAVFRRGAVPAIAPSRSGT